MSELRQSHSRVGVIGGTNGTGAQFAKLLAKRGFEVEVSGRSTPRSNADLAASSDLLVFAPPLKICQSVIEETVPHCVRPDQLVVDLCSLKEAPMRAMAFAKGRVIGLHPLFGPSFEDVSGQDLVICDAPQGRDEPIYRALFRELQSWGLKLHEMTASEHDQLMATIQVIPHLSALVSGALFRQLGIDAGASLKICSPVYKTELYMIGRIHSQNPALYASIIANNDHSGTIAQALRQIVGQVGDAIATKDVQALERAFEANKAHLGPFADEAREQSQRLFERAFQDDSAA